MEFYSKLKMDNLGEPGKKEVGVGGTKQSRGESSSIASK
jgi:hypothetical protein